MPAKSAFSLPADGAGVGSPLAPVGSGSSTLSALAHNCQNPTREANIEYHHR